MIDAKELRIGNLVRAKRPEKKIWVEAHPVSAHTLYSMLYPTAMDLHPIPLTAERLEEFGIPKVNGCYAAVYGLWFNKSLTGWNIENDIHPPFPKYVHTFQNLYFALTGEELKRESK